MINHAGGTELLKDSYRENSECTRAGITIVYLNVNQIKI